MGAGMSYASKTRAIKLIIKAGSDFDLRHNPVVPVVERIEPMQRRVYTTGITAAIRDAADSILRRQAA